MTYAVDQDTGHIYSEDEYWDTYRYVVPDAGAVHQRWEQLPHIEVSSQNLERVRMALYLIYHHSLSPEEGTLIKDSFSSMDVWYVTHVKDGDVWVESCNKRGYIKKWDGPFIQISSVKRN